MRRPETLLTKQQTLPTPQRPEERDEPGERAAADGRKPFVEPSVSVPADVLKATALFQAPTVQISIVP